MVSSYWGTIRAWPSLSQNISAWAAPRSHEENERSLPLCATIFPRTTSSTTTSRCRAGTPTSSSSARILVVVALEVKDWRLQTIARTAPDGVVIKTADGEYVARHPLQQARDYILTTVDLLKQRPVLRADDRLCCGWGYGAVLPSLKTADIRTPSLFGPTLEEVLGPGLVLTADDLTAERLLPRLRALLPPWAKRPAALTPDQMDEIRAVLYPEIRVGWGLTSAEILRVMDLRQEQLARSLGGGHQLLRGVAGSGKTVVLACRARYLREKNPTWRILVLCFNRTLADFLRHEIGADDRLDVMTFHAWCRRELQHANITMPTPPERGRHWQKYWEEVPRLLLDAYGEGHAAGGTYQAILVDEGQDFAGDWYRAILKALDPVTNSLFIALDSSQNIYQRKVTWREIGVQIVGHSRVLRINYRNTRPILAVPGHQRARFEPDRHARTGRGVRGARSGGERRTDARGPPARVQPGEPALRFGLDPQPAVASGASRRHPHPWTQPA